MSRTPSRSDEVLARLAAEGALLDGRYRVLRRIECFGREFPRRPFAQTHNKIISTALLPIASGLTSATTSGTSSS